MRILVVEDDDLIGSGLEVALQESGFAVDWAKDGLHARLSIATTRYDLILLDLGLPHLSGTSLLAWLRAEGHSTPVLILTARDTPSERVAGLDAGADDYVGKPFDLPEVISRCRALLRRSQNRADNVLKWRDLMVDPSAQTVMQSGEKVTLTGREFAVLLHLLTHAGEPQHRAKIEESLYGWRDEVESNAIEVHVSNLRKKIGSGSILTIRGVGYLMEKM